jgi:hypothetical protein
MCRTCYEKKQNNPRTNRGACLETQDKRLGGRVSKKFRNLPRRVSRLQGVVDGSEKVVEVLNESTKKTAFSSAA